MIWPTWKPKASARSATRADTISWTAPMMTRGRTQMIGLRKMRPRSTTMRAMVAMVITTSALL